MAKLVVTLFSPVSPSLVVVVEEEEEEGVSSPALALPAIGTANLGSSNTSPSLRSTRDTLRGDGDGSDVPDAPAPFVLLTVMEGMRAWAALGSAATAAVVRLVLVTAVRGLLRRFPGFWLAGRPVPVRLLLMVTFLSSEAPVALAVVKSLPAPLLDALSS